jgi:alanine racemase
MRESLRCWTEVDLEALRSNLAWIRRRIGPRVRVITVVKADAYGHGLRQIAGVLMQSGTDMFGVANLTEARAIRSVGAGWPILMLGACLPAEVRSAVRDEVRPVISSLAEVRAFASEAVRQRKVLPVHLKVDTGMGRLGIRPEQAVELALALRKLEGLRLEGLCSHFASAEDDRALTKRQQEGFGKVLHACELEGITFDWVHLANSAGLLLEPDALFNAVRPGLLVYGIAPRGRRRLPAGVSDALSPALTWKCRVAHVKDVPAGTPLSYGGTFVTRRRTRVATLTAGYGDGYLRSASNRARVLVGGRTCPVLGRVTMDQMLVDVTRVPNVSAGDEAVLLGRQGAAEIPAHQLAGWMGTIPWEVLTHIAQRVPRIYLGGHAA